jgi:type I restriction enzyme R subunit
VKEAARAKIRVVVKRLLKKYGYPPDMSFARHRDHFEAG